MQPKDILAIDPLLTDRARLAILSTLAGEEAPLDFNSMLEKLGLTKGNFSVHARKLEDAGLIEVEKKFVARKPVTTYSCTAKGRKALVTYLEHIQSILSLSTARK